MTYRIVYDTKRLQGFWAHIFCDCQTCKNAIGLKFENEDEPAYSSTSVSNYESDKFPDEKFVEIVRSNGWYFDPGKHVICPDCLSKLEV